MRAQLSVRGLRFAAGSLSSRSLSSLAELLNNGHPYNNVPESVKSRVGMQLHRREKHPLNTIKTVIHEYFSAPVRPRCVLGPNSLHLTQYKACQ